jgi:tRNA G18 (ribose-2'-O)-methylase SpoU
MDIVKELQEKNIHVLAIEQAKNATMLQNFCPKNDRIYAVVFGHEVKGVSQEVVSQCDEVIEIPQFGTKHSLNIAVSCGVVLWDLFSKINQP